MARGGIQRGGAPRWVNHCAPVLIAVSVAWYMWLMLFAGGAGRPLVTAVSVLPAAAGVALLAPYRAALRPRRAQLDDMLSVFFTFGMAGPLLALAIFEPTPGLGAGIASVIVAGGISASWAAPTTFGKRWLALLPIVATVALPIIVFRSFDLVGVLGLLSDASERTRTGSLFVTSVASMVAGYTLMARVVAKTERVAERQRAELETAAAIHRTLVPRVAAVIAGAELHGRSEASREMGGDLLDVIERGDGFDLVLGDVTGHGVKAGVVMALAKGVVRAELRADRPLAEAAAAINDGLCGLLETGVFVTCVLIRAHGDRIECVVAGHPPVLLWRAGRPAESVETIESGGLPLGVSPGERFELSEVAVAPGDSLLVYSDGLIESVGADGKQIGITGLASAASRLIGDGPERLVEGLLSSITGGASDGAEADDRTAVAVRFG